MFTKNTQSSDAYFITFKHTRNLGKVVEISHMAITLSSVRTTRMGSRVENLLKILFYHEFQGDTQMLDLIENKFIYHGICAVCSAYHVLRFRIWIYVCYLFIYK